MNQLSEKIAEAIRRHGSISFARFMEMALYCPEIGYYEAERDTVGKRGDFYTSVSVGSLFGELLAFQFAEWLEELPGSAGIPASSLELPELAGRDASAPRFHLVEAGAHNGQLARDILSWMRKHRPALTPRLKYWILEPSPRGREWQGRTLKEFGVTVRWAADFEELSKAMPSGIRGIIFCNELLDALPVHRLGWDAKARHWFEWGVTMETNQFVWTRMSGPVNPHLLPLHEPGSADFQSAASSGVVHGPNARQSAEEAFHEPVRSSSSSFSSSSTKSRSSPSSVRALGAHQVEALTHLLPDGFTIEISPAAEAWWTQSAKLLERGKLLAIDYGLTTEQFFVPERKDGTLRAYRGHRLVTNVLADAGSQDITAQVNFSALQAAGEVAGLKTESLRSQSQFLTPIAARLWGTNSPSTEETRQFQTLTHPNHLGRAFNVLLQSRE